MTVGRSVQPEARADHSDPSNHVGPGEALATSAAHRPGLDGGSDHEASVTKHEQAPAGLRNELQLLRGLLQTAMHASVVVDQSGVIVLSNAAAEWLLGYRREELVGERVEILVAEGVRGGHRGQREKLTSALHACRIGVGCDLLACRKDGSEFPAEIVLSRLNTDDGMLISVVIGDVSQRKTAEAQTARLAAIVQSSDDAIIAKTLAGSITSWNPAAERMYGYSTAEALGQHINLLCTSSEQEHEIARMLQRVAGGQRIDHFETTRGCKDGRAIDVSVTISPIRNTDGKVDGASTVARDITTRKQAEGEQTRLAAIVESCDDAIYALTAQGVIQTWNPAAERLFGYSAKEAIGAPHQMLTHSPVKDHPLDDVLAGETIRVEGQAVRRDGSIVDVGATLSPIRTGDRIVGVAFIVHDITARKRVEHELQRLADAAEHGTDAVVSFDRHQIVQRWSHGAERLYGFTAEEAIGRPVHELVRSTDGPEEVKASAQDAIARSLAGRTVRQLETQRRRKDGAIVDVLFTLTPWRRDRRVIGVTTVAVDISERKQMELRLRHLADHDPLTGIYNRRRLIEELDRQLRYAARSRRAGALLTLDLDHLKVVNDTYGHAAGDAVLTAVTEVLRSRTRETDVVARLGDDEFAVILPEASENGALTVARDIRELLIEPQIGRPIPTSIGIALFTGGDAISADEILACADTALYQAKEHGGDQARVYTGQVNGALTWVQRIHTALAEDRFVLYGQPILDLHTGQVTHHELLIRMLSEHGEIIAPAQFIPTAERFGLIHEIDHWVTTNGLCLARDGQPVTINLSGHSIGQRPIIAAVRAAIADGLDPANVIFEITETAALSNITAARQFAATLTSLGCAVALDDFGTGFGTFSYLKHIPAQYLKIDIEFVRELATSDTDQQVVKAIVAIAHSLDKLTIAEGVENAETLDLLKALGVDQAQGYHLGKPTRLSPPTGSARARR
jgi:diguanylate cyclase (GGDEF)-like protein/PAS domain S-box-containing protein